MSHPLVSTKEQTGMAREWMDSDELSRKQTGQGHLLGMAKGRDAEVLILLWGLQPLEILCPYSFTHRVVPHGSALNRDVRNVPERI